MADTRGFKPLRAIFHTLSDFKSDAIDHSATYPMFMVRLHRIEL